MRAEVAEQLHKFGYQNLRPGQDEIITAVLAGRDVLGILPTGSGKTLCYQIPGMLLPGITLVVEPLLALMREQVLRMQASGAGRVVALNSSLDKADMRAILATLATYKFVFISPELLSRPDVLSALTRSPVSLMVVDEAHCIYQWGPDFRPAYLRLGDLRVQLGSCRVLALTATAPISVREVIGRQLRMQNAYVYAASVDRPELFLGVEEYPQDGQVTDRVGALLTQVHGPAIIYCRSKHQTEELAARFAHLAGRKCNFYHAGVDEHSRMLRERQFINGGLDTLFATSAFGMGVDKPDVRMVLYLGVPATLEDYQQAIGRAGRDGQPAVTALIYSERDVSRTAQFISALPAPSLVNAIYRDAAGYANSDDAQIQLIVAYHQAHFTPAAVNAALSERLTVRSKSFMAVLDFLRAADCHRAALMRHFDSEGMAHTDACCGHVTDAFLATLPEPLRRSRRDFTGWQVIFKQIFNTQA
ncbi:RecQ family ATP-dependent DNA helicase [Lacticaseibacillus zhaodongensis]|uniref:RecQ family ATP-dependent DNA helicase n=1 Tax=Lacticaseibacillus zhaodongensis TaxID=2668065 RepID=UPI0012D2E338|nr:RecQ family ATP-dependent DNA helicase [Lacticaseibacillus zhaodongensis]